MNKNVYKRYETARNLFYIKKKWLKNDPEALKEEYGDWIEIDSDEEEF